MNDKISDRTIYCQTHLADVTLTGVRTDEQETNIAILRTFSPNAPTLTAELAERMRTLRTD